jgi:aryl-alcohol dehydrogenase-like predicted oxidoreductase
MSISELCLGAVTFGLETDEATAGRMLSQYLDAGGNFIDTANSYPPGRKGVAEGILGRLIAPHRDELILATKCGSPMTDEPNDRGTSPRNITRAVDASLRRLQTDWIDLFQLHWPDRSVPNDETLVALNDLVRTGKVRAIGVCNHLASDITKLHGLAQRHGWATIATSQVQYSLVSRTVELEILPVSTELGIVTLPWSPLGGGVLAGRYPGGSVPQDSRVASGHPAAPVLNERSLRIAAEVRQVSASEGRSPAQVALNWVLDRPGVAAPILGVRTVEQLTDNLGATGWTLDGESRARLDAVSSPELPYPHDFYARLGHRSYD